VGADKAYDTGDFVDQVREVDITPHVAHHDTRRGGSAIDARTTRHAGAPRDAVATCAAKRDRVITRFSATS
jgi:hypothetical protein